MSEPASTAGNSTQAADSSHRAGTAQVAEAARAPGATPASAGNPANPGRLRLFLVLLALGALGYALASPFLAQMIGALLAAQGRTDHSPWAIVAMQSVQVLVLVALAAFAGVRLCARAGLDAPRLRALSLRQTAPPGLWRMVRDSVVLGTLATLATVAALLVVRPFAPEALWKAQGTPDFFLGASSAFYGGIIEELLLRWGVLTALCALLRKLGAKDGFWAANLAATLLFGLGHLPAALHAGLPATPGLYAHVLLGNGVAGLFMGYTFRRRGLESAMVAHGTADVWLHGVMPFVLR